MRTITHNIKIYYMSTKVFNSSKASIDKNSVGVSYENTVTAEVGTGVSNKNASIDVAASVKAGTSADASAGLHGKNVFVNSSYSDTTEAHLTSDASVQYNGIGADVSVDSYMKSGNEASINLEVGQNGISAGGNVSSGSCVGVDGQGTLKMRGVSTTAGAGVSVGEHFEAGGSGEATFKGGKATVGVSGDVAALVGLDVDVKVSVDTKKVSKDCHTIEKKTQETAKKAKKVFKF
jgi:hypothetical protein